MKPVVVVGIGELGAIFARGFLRVGRPVYPVTRAISLADAAALAPDPELVLLAVGESELHDVLSELPPAWQDRVGLLQNELLPRTWRAHDIESPTVAVVWFEKKPTSLLRELRPTALFGPQAELLAEALGGIGVETVRLPSETALIHALVEKNLYILTTNIAGLETGGSVSELWREHQPLARRVADDVLNLQAHLTGVELPRQELISGMVRTFEADPQHACTGRSAPARLSRALRQADAAGLEVAELRRIARGTT
jgi:hypothetical protein